ncbi:hypothetical protein ABL78_2913 [Leptomonas seymouri]|uniref:Protein-serine/threonine kinase n=1 Tax=Leptomonas seymouri TaxID=5684 RepID=A0A0N0P768_LEPSE|nr:hypothetical protein ABL78_2913 [Leptomonas seymouri]|eukprot:KPI87977.1 hypothetical protein ABL78_2913 [Leptomonas seymouri]
MQGFAANARRKPICDMSTLQKYLSLPQTPMELPAMCRVHAAKAESGLVNQLVREMAVRTSRCYQAFSEPVIQKALRKPHAERLRWVKTFVLREFNYCVALHRSVESATELISMQGAYSGPSASISLLDSAVADNFYDDSSLPPYEDDVHRLQEEGDDISLSAGPSPLAGATESGLRSHRRLTNRELTHREVECILESWSEGNTTMPLATVLRLLQPHQSLLDVIVNETTVRSDELNGWLLRFCRRRVAWRVIHEYLLHLITPNETKQVICSDASVEAIVQQAGNAVVEIFSDLVENGSVHSLELNVEENARILTEIPTGTLISSSTSQRSCPCDATDTQRVEPRPSTVIYSIEGHLLYVFREMFKNASVATLRLRPDINISVHYAMDDKWVVLDFVDQAGGISPEHFKNIWKFGWTTSEHYESHLGGFGVGLSTSKVYMDMCGGSIDLYCTPRQGTTVRVRFPKAPVEILVPDSTLPPVPPS